MKETDQLTTTSNTETLALYRELEQRGYDRGYADGYAAAITDMQIVVNRWSTNKKEVAS